jgi:hypothetical protein
MSIYIGYQGIGKTELAKRSLKYIDLESSNFFIGEYRDRYWYVIYYQIAVNISNQGNHVFVSSHKDVRDVLSDRRDVIVVYPSLELKDKWIEKLKRRWEETNLDKDYKAYMNAKDRYSENITEIMNSGFERREILGIDYNLELLLEGLI